jgi:hypothetical protein
VPRPQEELRAARSQLAAARAEAEIERQKAAAADLQAEALRARAEEGYDSAVQARLRRVLRRVPSTPRLVLVAPSPGDASQSRSGDYRNDYRND